MDVLNEFSLTYQVSSWLLIRKREFAVVGNEMSVSFSVSVWEQWPPEYKLGARAKTLICEAQVLIWWCHSLPLMLFLSTQIISVNIGTIFFLGALGSWWQAACWWAVTEMSSQLLLGHQGPPCQCGWSKELAALKPRGGQTPTWTGSGLQPDFRDPQQRSEKGKSPWAYGGIILEHYIKGRYLLRLIISLFWSPQLPWAASGSWRDTFHSDIQWGRSYTIHFRPAVFHPWVNSLGYQRCVWRREGYDHTSSFGKKTLQLWISFSVQSLLLCN